MDEVDRKKGEKDIEKTVREKDLDGVTGGRQRLETHTDTSGASTNGGTP